MHSETETTTPAGHRHIVYNWISFAGFALIIVATLTGASVFVAQELLSRNIPYVAVLYTLLGFLALAGAVVVPLGALRERHLARIGKRKPIALYTLDLNRARDRGIAMGALVGIVALVAVVAGSSYNGFVYMSSDAFCGGACHVMAPEGIAHVHSPHANIDCVSCHVGEGAPSHVAAKLSGVRRLSAVLFDTYSRPIPTPIEDMRPANEACEQCHWRDRFIGLKEKVYTYYEANTENTPHFLRLLIKVGGREPGGTGGFGIHYHMQLNRKVELIARDRRKQDIAWVRVTEPDGTVREFNSKRKPLSDEERRSLPVHTMDCLDCHNRPAHQFTTPVDLMNQLLSQGAVSPALPNIKAKGVAALAMDYATTQDAVAGIDATLRAYYQAEHADFAKNEGETLTRSIAALQDGYRRTNFPEMQASWKTYVDNIGHRDYPGCFRCHNDDMQTSGGQSVFSTCDKCHVVLAQDTRAPDPDAPAGLTFRHFGDDSDIDAATACTDCHSGSGI